MTRDPQTELESGVRILEPTLIPHGFVFSIREVGLGSGGYYAFGEFFRDERSLFLHHRRGLGIIEYQVGDVLIDHAEYMKLLGVENQSDVLWMPLEAGADRYRALRSDLGACLGNRPWLFVVATFSG